MSTRFGSAGRAEVHRRYDQQKPAPPSEPSTETPPGGDGDRAQTPGSYGAGGRAEGKRRHTAQRQ